ncbi:DOPA-like domain-containing protein [Suillus plorans]|uniref:DOPA-like domain-containing protein n=1 Tax=Suillus plorans TaxID=116603 RepID=A0A9P7J297_9AGAM|nr:DOPA-like domain-containing protein [Suillus plorans]KAG1799353.1 DOPA-like domain-containing protein [Suillus plorans]
MSDYHPPTDLEEVVNSEVKEWHFHIYFHQRNADQHQAALELRDAVLRLRRDGTFVAVPLFRVNTDPIGPHPVGKCLSYPSCLERNHLQVGPRFIRDLGTFDLVSSVFSFLCMNRGNLSILIHPLTREARKDHELRNAWIGPPFPLDLSALPVKTEELPVQYPSLKLGYSAPEPEFTLDQRRRIGANLERILKGEKEAARAPMN